MKNHSGIENCELCRRQLSLTFHHLIPSSVHRKRWVQKRFSKEDLRKGVWLCRDCHDAVHRFISNEELAQRWNTIHLLLEHPEVRKFVNWVSKQHKIRNRSLGRKR